MIKKIVVAGAGTMGSGIALSAAQHEVEAILFDINADALERAKAAVNKNLDYLLIKKKIGTGEADEIRSRILYTQEPTDCVAPVIIEAIIEKEEAKVSLLTQLAAVNAEDTILASNTSSLSITSLQEKLPHPERVAGMHFFNPAQVMKLVEVVKGKHTSSSATDKLMQLCEDLQKTPVLCTDAPGFIVNRVARHFYLESLSLVENNEATPEQVDAALEAAGFKMGPFKLMDLIGMDINLAVSESLYEAFDGAIRFTPSALQQQKVSAGELGRKTGKGFYDYSKQTK